MHIVAVGGSLFLFDRKTLRYFRKDGHNWRKKKDGKTVKEAHEKLKVSKYEVFSYGKPIFGSLSICGCFVLKGVLCHMVSS